MSGEAFGGIGLGQHIPMPWKVLPSGGQRAQVGNCVVGVVQEGTNRWRWIASRVDAAGNVLTDIGGGIASSAKAARRRAFNACGYTARGSPRLLTRAGWNRRR